MSAEKKMLYVRLGNSGLKVSKIILGCMSYGDPEWAEWVLKEDESIEHIKVAYKAGINTFDTANGYSAGASEEILGKAIRVIGMPRESIVVLTKVFMPVTIGSHKWAPVGPDNLDASGYVNQYGLSRKHIFESVKASLKRLDLQYVDVLQCHRFDYNTPIEETMQALHDVVKLGWVRYIGMSSCYAYQFQAMQNYAINNKLTPFISMQNFHNAVYREEEREMMPTLKMFGAGCIPWSPLARGFLARPFDADLNKTKRGTTDFFVPIGKRENGIHEVPESSQEINRRIQKVAKDKGFSMAQIALAWSIASEGVSAPIVGTTTLENLQELIEGVHIKLTPEEKKYIDEPYTPMAITGHT